jgi:DNA-directed RNA polymerase subunit E"
MVKKHTCKQCKMFYDEEICPNCKSSQRAINWKGRINVLDSSKSDIAKKIGIEMKGEYGIKVR